MLTYHLLVHIIAAINKELFKFCYKMADYPMKWIAFLISFFVLTVYSSYVNKSDAISSQDCHTFCTTLFLALHFCTDSDADYAANRF